MRKLLSLALPLGALALLGCNNSPEGGSPGTRSTFSLKAPTLTTTIKQGDTQTVNLTVDRDDEFKQSVSLDASEPKGLQTELSKDRVGASDPKEVSLTIKVDKDAPLGDHIVKVSGKPETGTATSVDVKVKVEPGPKS